MRYRQQLIYCHAIRPLRCGDAYSRRSQFELHNHNVITNRRIAAE